MSVCPFTCRLSIYKYVFGFALLFCSMMLLSVQTLRIRCHYPLIYYSSRAIIFLTINYVFSILVFLFCFFFLFPIFLSFDRLHIVIIETQRLAIFVCVHERTDARIHNRSKLNLSFISISFVSY